MSKRALLPSKPAAVQPRKPASTVSAPQEARIRSFDGGGVLAGGGVGLPRAPLPRGPGMGATVAAPMSIRPAAAAPRTTARTVTAPRTVSAPQTPASTFNPGPGTSTARSFTAAPAATISAPASQSTFTAPPTTGTFSPPPPAQAQVSVPNNLPSTFHAPGTVVPPPAYIGGGGGGYVGRVGSGGPSGGGFPPMSIPGGGGGGGGGANPGYNNPSFSPPFNPNSPTTSYSGSKVSSELLRSSVLRDEDILLVDLTGTVPFDRTVGVHVIPLQAISDRFAAPSAEGAYYIGQGQSLIVTDFAPFAAMPNVGLPGSHTLIDPISLIGQVCFSLVERGGGHPLNQQSVTPNSICSGNSFLDMGIRGGYPVITSTIKTGSVSAQYQVSSPPFPGFPQIVGVRVRGYLVDSVLLNQIQNEKIDGEMPILKGPAWPNERR